MLSDVCVYVCVCLCMCVRVCVCVWVYGWVYVFFVPFSSISILSNSILLWYSHWHFGTRKSCYKFFTTNIWSPCLGDGKYVTRHDKIILSPLATSQAISLEHSTFMIFVFFAEVTKLSSQCGIFVWKSFYSSLVTLKGDFCILSVVSDVPVSPQKRKFLTSINLNLQIPWVIPREGDYRYP